MNLPLLFCAILTIHLYIAVAHSIDHKSTDYSRNLNIYSLDSPAAKHYNNKKA